MLRLARRSSPFTLSVVFVAVLAQHAAAATSSISIVDFAFNPSSVSIKQGDVAAWKNNGSVTHTSTSDTGLNLWNSGNLSPSQAFNFTFSWAGGYPYHCAIHSTMHGTVNVSMKASPTTGPVGTKFVIRWANAPLPANRTDLAFLVQKQNPGGTFQDWKVNTTKLKASFIPTAAGTYSFQVKMVRLSGGVVVGSGNFSAVKSISAT